MNQAQNKRIHGLLSQLNWMEHKAALAESASNERTSSTKELSYFEANVMIKILQDERERRVKGSRGKIIHQLCLLGYVRADGSADYERIDKFIKNIGSNNPKRRSLLQLWPGEVVKVCTQVHQMYLKEMNK